MIYDLGWIFAIVMIIGAIINAYKNKWCFILWTFSGCGWIVYNINTGTYNQIPVWVVAIVINIIGFYRWNKEDK